MSVETSSSLFTRVIQDHLELKERNAELQRSMPIERCKTEDPFENHPLFKTEEQARIEDTMDGEVRVPAEAPLLTWAGEDTAEHPPPEPEESLWSRSRDFDCGD